jgi:urocanate hydratase
MTNNYQLHALLLQAVSIGYHGNVVSLWERLVQEYEETGELLVDLGSDQTSCHDPYSGGYYPVQLEYEEAQEVQLRKGAGALGLMM